ncbi:putative ankyrin repeat protein RF_0381 [Saccostrea echinata]|uniref:putative ankyrin repeat protein RF_0381 n=1 Tax=Saccostrea echinata TaxID=191078 RepID=UPI002A7F1EE8|nr:putative ankyrin repeat protein RF_0381 [Saccostrea echinata]
MFLVETVFDGDINVLQMLLKSGVDVNVLDENGEPLLFTPIVNGDMDTLKLLLAYTDVNMMNDDCRTALMIAVEMGEINMVKKINQIRCRCKQERHLWKNSFIESSGGW